MTHRVVCVMMALVVCASTLTGAEYRGDQHHSPILRFLHNLFLGESGHSTQFNSSTYRVSAQSSDQGPAGASISTNASPITSQTIWNGTNASAPNRYAAAYAPSVPNVNASQAVGTFSNATTGNIAGYSSGDGYSSSYSSGSGSAGSSGSSALSSLTMTSLAVSRSSASGSASTSLSDETSSASSSAITVESALNNRASYGFKPPPAQPMPVGDGVWVLLTLAFAYLFLIRKRIIRMMRR